MNEIEKILARLVECESVSPFDANCQKFMMNFLQNLGFSITQYDNPPVANFIATIGNAKPYLMFAGHTDVVTPGDLSKWNTSPFNLTIKDNSYFGRGVADMKGSIAAMLVAITKFITLHKNFSGTIGFLITSGEEGDFYNQGTPYVMEKLKENDLLPDYCVIGEPSSNKAVGDEIKIGRRGSLNGIVKVNGKQGHVAYPQLADNPILRLIPALNELVEQGWDLGNEYFPPTSFQITHIKSGEPVYNVIPQDITFYFNFRYSNETNAELIKAHINEVLNKYSLESEITFTLSGLPFLTKPGALIESAIKIIEKCSNQRPLLSTNGGTSDGRFIAPYGVEVIELGPQNSTIHQVNECIGVNDLEILSTMYYELIKDMIL